MTERHEARGNNPFEIGKKVLQEAVMDDGGLMGLFGLARTPEGKLLITKYEPLLRAAVSPEEKAERRRQRMIEEAKDPGMELPDRMYMQVASIKGLHPDDVPAMLVAAVIFAAAFPNKSADEISRE